VRRASIGRQLSIGLAASLLAGALLLGVVATALLERALRQYALANLEYEARSVLAAIAPGPQGLRLETARLSPAYATPLSGRYFVVDIGETRWRSRSLWDAELPVPHAPGAVPGLIDGPQRQRLLCLRADYRRHGAAISVVVAADMAPLLAQFGRIGLLLLGLGSTVVALLTWVQRWWMRRAALGPLQQAQLQQLQRGERELLEADAPRELEPLIAEINRLLAHTRASLARSRHALGNLGHALKTPLAVLLSVAERADPELRATLHAQLAQMQRRIARELGRARTAGEAAGGERFAPQEELPLLIESVQRAHGRALHVEWQAPAGTLALERDDMLELLGNLLDNACKWARLAVRLRIETQPRQVSIRIEDDGPGIAEARRAQVLARGARLDEDTEGHGLGLAIVGDIVAAYHGALELARSPLGGLLVLVELPLQ
jgi:signal transduction histidine kinase